MSYSESNGQVILTMSREDFDRILLMCAALTVHVAQGGKSTFTLDEILGFVNRLNSGNPHYAPYQVEEKKP